MSVYITSRRHESEVFMNLTSLSLSCTCMYGLLLAYSWRNAVVPCLCTMHLYHTIDNSSFNTLQCRFDLNDVLPIRGACGEQIQLETPHDVIREQFWLGSTSRKSTYLFDQDLFHFYDLLQKNNPGVSETGFLKTLEQMSEVKGRVSNNGLGYLSYSVYAVTAVTE